MKTYNKILFTFLALVLLFTFSFSVPARAQGATLAQGPIVGGVNSTSAIVWDRSNDVALINVRYSTDPDMITYNETSAVQTASASDFTAKVKLSRLKPQTVYYLNILVNGALQLTPPYPQFKTYPADGVSTPFKFVVLNDFQVLPVPPDRPHVTTFASSSAENPDFVILGGDMTHANPTTLTEKRRMFTSLYTYGNDMDDFINLILRRYPVSHVWDDHDYGANNADKKYTYKKLSLRAVYEEFPTYLIRSNGIWQKFSYGQADFFLLDSRYERDMDKALDGLDKSLLDGNNLGASGQLQWLLNGLKDSTSVWKFIYTPSVFNPTSGKIDSWASFMVERQQILDFINFNNIQNVILLSGDMHIGGIDDGTNAGLPEMLVPPVSSGVCLTWDQPGTWSEGTYSTDTDFCLGYGLVTVLTGPDRVVLEVKDSEANLKISYTILANTSATNP